MLTVNILDQIIFQLIWIPDKVQFDDLLQMIHFS